MASWASIRRRGDTALAWGSMVFAVVGGALAAGTGIGTFIAGLLGGVPWPWLPGVLMFIAVCGLILDLLRDGEPNQVAVAGAILLPSVAAATHGSLAHWVVRQSRALAHAILPHLQGWVGTSSSTGLALAAIGIACFAASRVVPKKSRGGSRGRSRATVEVG